MEPVVLLGRRDNGITVLDMNRVGPSAPPHELLVELTAAGLSAAAWIYEHPDFGSLVAYLKDLEQHWRGWEDQRQWASLEGQLTVAARHTGGRIELDVVLARAMAWKVETSMPMGAGEELSNCVRAAETWLT